MGGHTLHRRDTAGPGQMSWFGPDSSTDRLLLDRWRRSVGPPVVREAAQPAPAASDRLTIVSWNIALGAGDVTRLVAEVRERIGRNAPLVLLLQEVYRRGADVPSRLTADSIVAGRLGAARQGLRRDDVAALAATLELGVCYVPSMRNGAPSESDEDRGNAILSNLPMNELAAIELPFERQRRVAVAATVSGLSSRGAPWTLRLVSAHLDNMVGPRRGWVAGAEYARVRQARGLVALLDGNVPTVLGGDFNTWFGFVDQVYVETARAFPQTRLTDTRATFHGLLRLDHLFFRLPDRWRAQFHRENDRFGSDHSPLVATITF
jgi:endonuclease/exonuclease/phosphatase family metal-dependent hydrolase